MRSDGDVDVDIFAIEADVALKLMCDSLETIMELTGDVPPTPPPTEPATPNMQSIRAEKEELKKRRQARPDVKLLLLGQAGSGKSTLLKQFQV